MYVHSGMVNKEIGFHTIENLTSLLALGSILKDFWEPVSIGVKVVFLVEHDETLYDLIEFEDSWGLQTY
jgi:hypothetical protein